VFARLAVAFGLAIGIFALVTHGQSTSAQTVPGPSPTTPSNSGISVLGSGIVLATPNTAHITIGVEVNDASLANAQAEAARRMDAVTTKLKADGIADDDIRTTSYNVNPQYDQNGALRSYQVQNLVDVKTTNVTGIGPLIDDAVNAGATRIYGISFSASNVDDLKNQARDQAMQNARAKAEQLARDGGVSLGRPISIEESDAGTTPVAARAPAPAAAFSAAPPTPIQPGELTVQTQVRVVYAIQ
jgi:uncharacterized protein YggE